jgi:hypothetical protein
VEVPLEAPASVLAGWFAEPAPGVEPAVCAAGEVDVDGVVVGLSAADVKAAAAFDVGGWLGVTTISSDRVTAVAERTASIIGRRIARTPVSWGSTR